MKASIIKLLKETIKEDLEVDVFVPENEKFGHYSTNMAFELAKIWKKSPMETAREIETRIKKQETKILEKIEVAAPGFINFWLKPEVFQKELEEILKNKDKYGRNNNLKKQKTIVEYTDPNPFKEFHIGHLMSNAIGEAVARLIEWNGAEVKRACYQGDVGLHVAKAVWGIRKVNSGFQSVEDLSKAYVQGAGAYEESASAKKEIQEINKAIYEKTDQEIMRLYQRGRNLSLAYFEEIYKKLGTKFDYYFFESEAGEYGKKIVERGLKNSIFERSDGAVVFRGEKCGLHTRVFINSEGLPTYEAKELGLADIKYKKYSYDKSVVITGNEINDYFKVVLEAMKCVFPKLAEKTLHLSHGMLRLPSGKMSSRTGEVIAAESLIGEIEKLVDAKIQNRDLKEEAASTSRGEPRPEVISEREKDKIKKIVAIGAIKYSILKQAVGGDIVFDFEKSISFEGDSGPYLQYAYTRAKSVLEKAREEKIKPSFKLAPPARIAPATTSEMLAGAGGKDISNLEPMLCRFPEIVESAGKGYAPHYLITYLIELARTFNAYYEKVKIVDREDRYSPYKIALTTSFMHVIKNGLKILGISVPEKM